MQEVLIEHNILFSPHSLIQFESVSVDAVFIDWRDGSGPTKPWMVGDLGDNNNW